MRRHVLIGRFGSLDNAQVATAIDEVETQVDLVASESRLGYGIGDALESLKALNVIPSEMGLDVLIVAALVHAADTRLSRATESQDNWTREIRLVLPVSDQARWTTAAPLLQRILNFLTGDRWTFDFRERPSHFARIVPDRPKRLFGAPFDSLSLFSGGLDSLIGAIDILEGGGTPLLVSHAGEGAVSNAQNTCFKELKECYKNRPFDRLRFWLNFPTNLVPEIPNEDTTRGRSFLFIALAVFAGTGFEAPFTVSVPENGLIALNVPLDPLRLGALSTRTTHPFYMARWNDLLAILGINGRVNNPYWDKTKGEMAASCKNQSLLKNLVSESLSCASPTKGRWHGHGTEHCGYCVPCLIRRAALNKSFGRGNDPTPYTVADLLTKPLDTRRSKGQQVRSFQFAIGRLRANPALPRILIHKPGPLTDELLHLDALADVYRRGMAEVADLLTGVHTRPS